MTIAEKNNSIEMPTTLGNISPADLGEYLQRFGALVAWANTVLGALDAKCIILKEQVEQRTGVGVLSLQQEKVKGTKDELAASFIQNNDELRELNREYTRTRALKAQAERLLSAYSVARDTFSRQVSLIELENNQRERFGGRR